MPDFTFSRNTRSPQPSDTHRLDMKDVTSNRHSRHALVYPKKRPSPHGVTKAHKSPLLPLNGVARRTPRHPKAALLQQQRQREAQIQALRREGIFIEDEYMDEIHRYMLEMEVRCSLMRYTSATTEFSSTSGTPCLPLNQWTNNQRLGGTCDRV